MRPEHEAHVDTDALALQGPDIPPRLLNRLEVARVAREKGLTTDVIVERLKTFVHLDNPAQAMRAIELLERIDARQVDDPPRGGSSTFTGDITVNILALERATKDLPPEKRREIIEAAVPPVY